MEPANWSTIDYIVVVGLLGFTVSFINFIFRLLIDLVRGRVNGKEKNTCREHCPEHRGLVDTVTSIDKTMAKTAVHIQWIRLKLANGNPDDSMDPDDLLDEQI